jgi:oligogalacturonide lyase
MRIERDDGQSIWRRRLLNDKAKCRVAHAKDGKWIYLFTPQRIPDVAGIKNPESANLIDPGFFQSERLVNLSKHDYRLEPNVSFTPDQKWIVFRSNMTGVVHTYAVEIAKAK